jgi:glycerol-3-phosphate dehydrogenase
MYFDVEDKRMIFAIPRAHCTYVGTTDTAYTGSLDSVEADPNDIEYILKSINQLFPDLHLKPTDVISTWAGLRPLIRQRKKSPSAISRKDELFLNPSGLITIAGGKLTGYRKMAERTVDLVCAKLNKQRSCTTDKIQLHGSEFGENATWSNFLTDKVKELQLLGIQKDEAIFLVQLLGSNIQLYIQLYQSFKDESSNKLPQYYKVLMLYCVKYEMAKTLEDIIVRRTADWYFRKNFVKTHEQEILAYAAILFHWDTKDRLLSINF